MQLQTAPNSSCFAHTKIKHIFDTQHTYASLQKENWKKNCVSRETWKRNLRVIRKITCITTCMYNYQYIILCMCRNICKRYHITFRGFEVCYQNNAKCRRANDLEEFNRQIREYRLGKLSIICYNNKHISRILQAVVFS